MPQCSQCGATVTRREETCSFCGSSNPAYVPPQPAPAPAPPATPQPAPIRPRRGRWRRWLVFGSLTLCGAFGLLMVLAAIDIQRVEERYGANIVALCNPIRPGPEGRQNLPDDVRYPLQVVVFRNDQPFLGSFHDDLRPIWRADNGDEADLVVCIDDPQRERIETCTRTDDEGETVTLERYRIYNPVVLFNARTLERITTLSVSGNLPDTCPEQVASSGGSLRAIEGREMTQAQFEAALLPFVDPE